MSLLPAKLEIMSLIMDNRLTESSDKDEELKRLKELVKKLEIQNHELKTERQAILSHAKSTGSLNKIDEDSIFNFKNRNSIIENQSLKNGSSMENSIAPLDLADVNISDDETWLISSPKTKSKPQLMKWLRKDVDDPTMMVFRKRFACKIEEIEDSQPSSPRTSNYNYGSSAGIISPESPPAKEIDTRTFIRPKKRPMFSNTNGQINGTFSRNRDSASSRTGSNEYLGHSNGSLGSEEDRLSSASDGSYSSFRLADVEDVNTLARLQEESLMLPEPRPLNRLAGMRSTTCHSKASDGGDCSAESSQEDLCGQQGAGKTSQRSSLQAPRKYQYSCLPQSTSRESSDLSSPAESPYNSQQNLLYQNGRRMPSLTRRAGADGTSPVTSRGASPLPADGYGNRPSRLQTPQSRTSKLAAPSPVRLQQSPSMDSEVLRMKQSGLPQSRLRRPKATQLPPDPNDWREGCY